MCYFHPSRTFVRKAANFQLHRLKVFIVVTLRGDEVETFLKLKLNFGLGRFDSTMSQHFFASNHHLANDLRFSRLFYGSASFRRKPFGRLTFGEFKRKLKGDNLEVVWAEFSTLS
jgi:hypothetical protein